MNIMIAKQLRLSIKEEKLAARHYKERALFAKRSGDEITAKLYLHISKEEMVHAKEFNDRLNKIIARLVIDKV